MILPKKKKGSVILSNVRMRVPLKRMNSLLVLSVVAFSTATVQLLGWEQQWMLTVNEQGDSSSSMLNSV